MTERSHTDAASLPVADLDRRFYALMVDQLVGATVLSLVGLLAGLSDSWPVRLSLLLGTAGLVLAAYAVGLGLAGATPGKAMLGLRVLDEESGRPIGVGRAFLRTLVVTLACVPTFGFGLATLALTAVGDPDGRRRGWHDRLAGSVVLDVRPGPPPSEPRPDAGRPMVNLTAARLVPAGGAPAAPPTRADPVPPTPAAPAVAAPGAPIRWRLTVDSGESVVIEGLALVGRVPAPRPGEQVRHLLPLSSRDLSVSKTHAALDVVDGVLVVTDRGSTNGSVLVRRGVSRELRQGRPSTLLDGDRIRFGDRECLVTRED